VHLATTVFPGQSPRKNRLCVVVDLQAKRPPTLVLVFQGALLKFSAREPQLEPLFQLPPHIINTAVI